MLKLILAPVTLVFTAIFMQQAWWIRGLGGAALGAILFIAIPALIEWASARTNVTTLRIDCAPDFLPTKLPAEGRVLVIQLYSTPEVPHQAGQSQIKYGDPGMLTGWPQGSDAYKCEVRNLGSAGLFDIAIILSVDFQEVLRKENGSVAGSGGLVRAGVVSIIAPRLEEKLPFSFYVTNQSPYYASLKSVNAAFTLATEKKTATGRKSSTAVGVF